MNWISNDTRKKFDSEGYKVVKNVVPKQLIQKACEEIAGVVKADLNDPSTWYNGDGRNDGIVPVHHLQSLWNIRQNERVFDMFSELWQQDKNLYVDFNRCCFRPPWNLDFPEQGLGEIHWDIDPRKGSKGWIQGIVLLTDIKENTGGFQCIPEIYANLDEWIRLNAMSIEFNHLKPGLEFHPTLQLSGQAGDVILWSTLLPHGPAVNFSDSVRIAAFITISPDKNYHKIDENIIELIHKKRAPKKWRGLPGQLDPEPGPPVKLTELGKKLVGIKPW